VTDNTPLMNVECRCVFHPCGVFQPFLDLMTFQAGMNWVGSDQRGRATGVRIVALRTTVLESDRRMLDRSASDILLHAFVTTKTKCISSAANERQPLSRASTVTVFTLPIAIRRMNDFLHQPRPRRGVGIVTVRAICRRKRQITVCGLQLGRTCVVAAGTKIRRRLCDLEDEFLRIRISLLVQYVTGVTSRIQGYMAASAARHVVTVGVATQAEIVVLVSGFRLLQEMIELGYVWVVTCCASSIARPQHASLRWKIKRKRMRCHVRHHFLVLVTFETERRCTTVLHFDVAHAFSVQHRMACRATHLHSGMDNLSFRLVCMTNDAVGSGGDWHRMNSGPCANGYTTDHDQNRQDWA
jgi:hypothetical protein